MAADFFIGESLVGDGNEVAHIDLIIGSKSGPAGQAFVNALSNQREGHSTLLAVVSPDRKSTRLNSSHGYISYAVFCLKKKKTTKKVTCKHSPREKHAT